MLKKNFTRKNFSNEIYQNLGFSKNTSLTLIDDFFESIISELIKHGQIKISSFGTFEAVNKKKRIGRNPKTKVQVEIAARKIVKFRPSIITKNKLNR